MADESPPPQTEPPISRAAIRSHSPLEDYYASFVDGQPPPVPPGSLPPIELPPAEFEPPSMQARRPILPLALLIGGFLVFNVVSVPLLGMFDGPGWVAVPLCFMLGAYATEVALLSCGVVFTCLPVWQRLSLHWLLAPLLLGAWLLAWQFPSTSNAPGRDDIAAMFLGLPLFLLAVQSPLWGLRCFFQWRIVAENDPPADKPLRPLAIRDLMLATVVVALSFAVARAAPAAESEPDYWLVWSIGVMSVAGVSAISIPPLLYWTLRMKWIAGGLAAIVLLALTCATAAFGLIYAFKPVARREFWPLLILPGFIFGYTFSLTVIFWIARSLGYRLKIGRST